MEEKPGSYYFFIPQVITFTFLWHAHDLEVFLSAFVQYKLIIEVIVYSDRGSHTLKFDLLSMFLLDPDGSHGRVDTKLEA